MGPNNEVISPVFGLLLLKKSIILDAIFPHLIGIDTLHPYAKYNRIADTVSKKINKVSVLGERYDVIGPKKRKQYIKHGVSTI